MPIVKQRPKVKPVNHAVTTTGRDIRSRLTGSLLPLPGENSKIPHINTARADKISRQP
jgi:hypothetical protein